MALVPCSIQQGTTNYLAVSLLREEMNNMFEFAQFLRSELDGAHYLGDGHQAMVMSKIDELSVKLNSLQAEHEHLINEHWVPLQQFASGVVASLSVLSGTDPSVSSPSFCRNCGRGNAPPQPQGEDGSGCAAPIPIGLISDDLRAFSIHPSNFPSPISSVSSLISDSSSKESLLHPSPLSLSLGARASGNGWEHVRNIERTGSIYLTCFR